MAADLLPAAVAAGALAGLAIALPLGALGARWRIMGARSPGTFRWGPTAL